MEKTCGDCAWLEKAEGNPDGNPYCVLEKMISIMRIGDMESRRASTMETETAYPQDKENNEYRYISPTWLNEIAKGLTKGAEKHPGETWRTIPAREHLARAMRHINLYLMGDRGEPHLINAGMRMMMAFDTSRNEAGE